MRTNSRAQKRLVTRYRGVLAKMRSWNWLGKCRQECQLRRRSQSWWSYGDRQRANRDSSLSYLTSLTVQTLEPRVMLAVDVTVDGSTVSFTGDGSASDLVYVRTANEQLQWSTDGSTFRVDLDSSVSGDQTLTIEGSTSQSISLSGTDVTLHLLDFTTSGASLQVDAPTIQVDADTTVSTVQDASNAGAITLQNATSITLDSGSTLNAGDAPITISAVDTPFQSFGSLSASAAVNLDNATITGGDVQITTEASAAALFGVDSLLGAFTLDTKNFFEGLSLGGGYVKSVATADINISGGSIIADALTLDAEATADAELTVITAIVGAAFGEMYPTATITIDDNATIETSSDVDISTTASLEAEVRATQFAFGLTSTSKEKYNIALAAASGELVSTISVGDANLHSGGEVSFISQGVKKIDVGATAAAGREGVAGLALGVSEIDSTVSALVDGSVTAFGAVSILADLTSTQNDTDAGASVGEGSTFSKVKKGAITLPLIAARAPFSEIQQLQNRLGSSKADTTAGKSGVAAAITLVTQTNDVTARIGENATVVSQNNDIEVLASSTDEIQNSSHSSVTSSGSAKNTRAKAWSASLLIGSLTNNAEAYIGRNADVQAAGDLLVQSETRVPWEQQWARWNGLDSITDKLNTNVGIQSGFFTTWTQASSKSEKLSIGGSVGYFSIDGHSDAFIDEGASVQAGAQTSIIALNENDTVNFGGQFATGLPLPGGFGLSGAASRGSGVGGSVAAMTYENHVNARIKDNAVVNTGGLLVMSRTDERNISIVTQGGAADGTFALNGAGNLLFVDNFTLAQIDDGAQVTVGSLNVAVPRDFDTVNLANNGFFSDVPTFDPFEQIGGTFDEPVYRVNVDTNEITLPYDHGLQSGDVVWYSNGGGVDIGGLSNNSAYTVSKIDDSTLQLLDGQQVVQLNLDETDGFGHSLLAGFEASSDVSGDTISGLPSYWEDNLPVRYFKAVGADTLTGLNPEQVYYLSAVDGGVQLLDAPDGNAVPIDAAGISGAQFLVPVTVDRDGASTEIVGLELKTRNPLRALDSNHDDVVSTDDEHILSVTDDVYLTDTSLLVLADDHAGLYSGTGGFTKGRSIGAGVAIAVSDIHRQTNAIFGNLERDLGSTLGVGVDSADEIYLGYNHGFSEGDLVTYAAGGDFPIAGLRDGECYFVNIVSDSNHSGDPTIKLARSILEAQESVLTHFALADVSPELGADSIDLGYTHGFQLGDQVMYSAGSGTAIGGLEEDTVYYVIPLSDTELALAESQIFATDAFSTIFDPRDTVNDNSLTFDHEHSFVDGQRLLYSAGGGTAIGGLDDGEVVVAVYVDEFTIQLETIDGSSIELDASSSVGQFHALEPGFLGTSDNIDGNVIDVGYTHLLDIGDQVLYTASTPADAIGGLTSGDVYYVVNTGETTLLLATSEELAEKAKWRFFDSTTAISNVTDQDGNVSSIIDLALPHPYELDDALVYSTEAYYEDPDSETISPLQYIDPTDGSTKTLVDGQTVYAIPADSDSVLDPDTGSDTTIFYGLQIALSEGGPALQLVTTNAAGLHGFHYEAAGIQLTPTTNTTTTHFLQRYERVDLNTSTGAGSDHTIRLALDPSSTTRATHGIGGTFDPSVTIDSESDDGDDVTEIDLGFNHGFATGDAVIYSNGRGTSIGGLAHGVIYYVVKVDSTTIQLTESAEDAGRSENLVALDASGASGALHGFGKVFDATPSVDSHLDTIQFGQAHGFNTGDKVVYETNGGTAIGGLEDGQTYVVQVYEGDDTKIQLLDVAGGDVIDLDGTVATGDQHTLSEPISNTGFITSTGAGLVTSNNNGEIVSISLAGSETAKRKAGNFSDTASSGDEQNPKYGISIAASFAINIVNDTTYAYVRDADLTATSLDLRARNVTEIDTGTGAIALATSTDNAKGGAGAFSINVIDNSTTAWVDNATVSITGGDLEVDAENSSHIVAAALGLAGTSGAFALAGSVVVNVISAHANALIQDDSVVTVSSAAESDGTGNVIVTASNDNQIIGVAGSIGVALGSGPTNRIGAGVAIAVNDIDSGASTAEDPRGTVALIEDSEVTASGVIDVSATTTNTIDSVAAAIAVSFASGKSMADAFSFSINGTRTATTAAVRRKHTGGNGQSGGQGVKVSASDDSNITSVAGNVAFAADSASGMALSFNVIVNTVSASIADTSLTATDGDVQVLATSTPTITSVAAGAAASGKAAREGSFSVAALLNTTEAYITGNSTNVTADGTVLVAADDDAHVFTLGGSVVLSGLTGQSSGEPLSSIGIANSTLVSVNTVEAYVDDNVTVQAGGNLDVIDGWSDAGLIVSANSNDHITTIAAGGVLNLAPNSISIAGSATVTVLDETTHAYIGSSATINDATEGESAKQSVIVRANETTTLTGVAGAADISLQGGGVGAGVDVAVVTKDVQAWIDEGSDVGAEGNVIVEATSHEDAISVSGTIAVGGSTGAIAGSVGVSTYDITTKAAINSTAADVTTVTAGGSVLVSAQERTVITVADADISVGENEAGGGSIGIPVFVKTTEAKIGHSAVVDALGLRDGITVNSGKFVTFDGDTSHSGLAKTLDLDNSNLPIDDKGYLENSNATPEQITGFKGVAVTAVNSNQLELYTLGASAASQAAVQVSLGVNVVDEDTSAIIEGSAQINQNADSTAGASADQSVLVAAGNDFFIRAVIGGVTGTGTAAATPGVGVAYITMDTHAYVAESAKVHAEKNLDVTAHNSEDVEIVSIAIAGTAGEIAAAGAFSVLDLNNTTYAYLDDNVTVDAGGNVAVFAEDLTDSDVIAGGVGIAIDGGGEGVSVGLSLISKETRAFIGENAIVDARGLGSNNTFAIRNGDETDDEFTTVNIRGLGVSAYSVEDMFAIGVAGGGGLAVGAAGSITWQQIDSDTRAYIDRNAQINSSVDNDSAAHTEQDVFVTALNRVTASGIDGALDVGVAGFGAAVDVGTIANVTEAAILADVDGDTDANAADVGVVNARQDVRAAATSDRDIFSIAAGLGGGIFALEVGFSFWTIGDEVSASYDVDGEAQDPSSGLDSATEGVANDTTDIDAGFTSSSTQDSGDNSDRVADNVGKATDHLDSFTDLLSFGDGLVSETKAYIGENATVNAGDDVDIIAHEDTQITQTGGAVADAALGVGGGIAIFNLASKASAYVDAGAVVFAVDDVTIMASADETTSIYAVAGGVGIAAVTAQYAESDVTSVQSASIGEGAQISSADALTIDASHTRDLHAFTAGGGLGYAGAAGFSGALVVGGGTVEAVVADNAVLGDVDEQGNITARLGTVDISATSTTTQARAEAYAVSAGVGLAIQGTESQAKVDPTVQAATLNAVQIYTTGDVSVDARAQGKVEALGLGVEIAAGIAGGFMGVLSEFSPSLVAILGDENTIDAGGDVAVTSEQSLLDNEKSAYASGYGVAASLFISIAGVTVKAQSLTESTATIGVGASVTTNTGTVTVKSNVINDFEAVTDGGSGGGIASSGNNVTKIESTTASQALLGDGVDISANTLKIIADSTEMIDGTAANNKFSFGFTSTTNDADQNQIEFATDVEITVDATTRAYIDDNTDSSQRIDVNTLMIDADRNTTLAGSATDFAVALIAGLGGARYLADVQSVVNASMGDGVVANAETLSILSGNTSQSGSDSIHVSSVTGGLGSDAKVVNEIDVDHQTRAGIGDNAKVNADYTLTGEPAAVSGGVLVLATNDARFFANTDLGSAGILGASNNASTSVTYNDYDAVVSIGDDTVLKSTGEITLATRSSAESNASADATSAALFNNTFTTATTSVDTVNTVSVGAGALVESEDDINLLAGQTGVLEHVDDDVPDINTFVLDADANAYSAVDNLSSAVGVTGTATVNQTNTVSVSEGASLRAVSDAYLYTESGLAVSEASAVFKTLAGDGKSESTPVTSDDNNVNIDGDIEVGLFNRRVVELDESGNLTSDSDSTVAVMTSANFSLDDALEERINTLLEEAAWFSGSSLDTVYDEQRAFWTELVTSLGGTLDFSSTPVQVSGVSLPTAIFSDIFATSGNISIDAENLTGSGNLTAPTDTTIQIVNNSPLTLFLNALEIPDRPGGAVRFNQLRITSDADIEDKNANENLSNLVNFTFNYSYDPTNSTADADTEPVIEVINNPLAGEDYPSNLIFEGNVSNRSGDVIIDSGDGSVIVNDGLTAGSLSITSGGDFVFSDTDSDGDGFFHVGGDPFDLYSDVAEANENASSLVSDPTAPRAGTSGSVSDDAGSTIIAGNVLISAENLNINGIIQSGLPYHTVTISDPDNSLSTTTSAISASYAESKALGGEPDQFTTLDSKYLSTATGNAESDLFDSSSDTLVLQWDALNERLVLLGNIEVKGGFMQLVGDKVLNTYGGELRVLDGYGTIDIHNETSIEIVLNNLNVGTAEDDAAGIEGVITITETSRAAEAAAGQGALTTRITRSGNQVTVLDNTTVDAEGAPTNVTTTNGSSVQYEPADGLRYQWVSSGALGSERLYELNNQTSPAEFDDVVQPANLVKEVDGAPSELTSSGSNAITDTDEESNLYQYEFTSEESFTDIYWEEVTTRTYDAITHKLIRTRYSDTVRDTVKILTTHTHSVKADYPIDITFLGGAGGITINSLGTVVIAGDVEARGGTVTVNAGVDANGNFSNSSATIESADTDGVLVGNIFSLSAPAGIGTEGPLYLEQTHADANSVVTAASTSGDISLASQSSDLTLASVTTSASGGLVSIDAAAGSVFGATKSTTEAHIQSGSVAVSAAGDVGTPDQFLHVNTGDDSTDTFTADVSGDVYLREITGDLRLASLEGSDVTIAVESGSLLDSTEFESSPRDADTIASLVTLWTDLGLIGSGADDRKALIQSDTIALRNFEYVDYWQQRNTLDDPTDPASFDFQYSDEKVARMLELGFTANEIDELEQSATDRFTERNAVYGPGGTYQTTNDPTYDPDTYDENFTYQLTSDEIDELTSSIAFTEEGLLWDLSTGVLNRTDTTAFDESPNIVADTIRVVASGSVGNSESEVKLIEVEDGDIAGIADDAGNTTKIELLSADAEDIEFFLQEQPGIVAAWSLDEIAGSTGVDDATGNGHAGVVSSGTTLGVAGATNETGTSAQFNGTTSTGINVPYSAALNPESFTVAVWAKVTGGTNTYRSVITSRSETGGHFGYVLYAANNNTWQFWTGNGSSVGWDAIQGPAVELDAWVHLAISFDADSNTKSLYVNGDHYASTSAQGYAPNPNNGTHIGTGGNNGGEFNFVGQIDDLGIYHTVLDDTAIKSAMEKVDAKATPWAQVDDGDGIVEADEYNLIQLTLREDVNVTSEDLEFPPHVVATASGGVLLGAVDSVLIDLINAGDAEVRIKAGGGVFNGAGLGVTNINAGNLIIESESLDIGTLARPVTFDLSGELTVRSAASAYVASTAAAGQAVNLDTAIVGDTFGLTAPGAIVDANDPTDVSGAQIVAVTNVIAGNVLLTSDTVGTAANPVEIEIDGSGALGGDIETSLYVHGVGSLLVSNLNSETGALHVTTDGDLLLGLINNENGSVDLESLTGSILNSEPNALNLLVADASLTVNAANATIGTADNAVEVLQETNITLSGPSVNPDDFAYIDLASRPLGVFTEGENIGGDEDLDYVFPTSFLELADFNGDGFLDVLTSEVNGDILDGRVLINNHDATFTDHGVVASTNYGDIHVGDLNNDGAPDILNVTITTSGDTQSVHLTTYLNSADGTASFSSTASLVASTFVDNDGGIDIPRVQLAEMNNQTGIDLVMIDPGNRVIRVFENNGHGVFSLLAVTDYPEWHPPEETFFTMAELTGDGQLDLILGPTIQSFVSILTNVGGGQFDTDRAVFLDDATASGFGVFGQLGRHNVQGLAVGDVNGDGLNDLVLGTNFLTRGGDDLSTPIEPGGPGVRGNEMWLNTGFGTIGEDVEILSSGSFYNVDPATVTGTQRLTFTRVTVEDRGAYAAGLDVGEYARQPILADLDLDGDLDLILQKLPGAFNSTRPNEVMLYEDGVFVSTDQTLSNNTGTIGNVVVGDLDNDFDPDVVFSDQIWLQSRIPIVTTGQEFFFWENRVAGESLYAVETLPVSETVTFALDLVDHEGTDVTEWFDIDGVTGEILVADPTALDYETFDEALTQLAVPLTFTVTITSIRGETYTQTLSSYLINLRDPAEFTDDLTNFSIDENSPVGTTIDVSSLATDDELVRGDRITNYAITGGTDGYKKFVIDSDGILTLISSDINYETFPSSQKYIDINIEAFDTENSTAGPGTVRVHINNVYEGPGLTSAPTPAIEGTYNFDAGLDGDGDNVWESSGSNQSGNWTLGQNVSRLAVTDPNSAALVVAYDFPGGSSTSADDYAIVASYQSFTGNPTDGDMSLELWFRPDDLTNNQVLWETGGNVIGSSLVLIHDDTTDEFVLRYTVRDNSETLIAQTTLPEDAGEAFIQVVATLDLRSGDDLMELYLDGELMATDSDAQISDWAGSDASGLGGRRGQTGGTGTTEGGDLNFGSFDGQIALLRFYQDTLLPNLGILVGEEEVAGIPLNYAAVIDGVAVAGDEGSTIALTRPFDSTGTESVTMTASIGTVIDNGDGTWTWTYDATDGPDENQEVTITATEASGLPDSTSFQLYVGNVAPTLVRGPNGEGWTVPVLISKEGAETQFSAGKYSDPGDDTVTLTTTLGTTMVHSPDIWFWVPNFTVDESIDGETVTVTATDDDGAQTSIELLIDYDPDAPQLVLDSTTVGVDEGSIAVNGGTYDADDLDSLSVSLGTITDNGDGTWSWSYDGAVDGDAAAHQVTITARDLARNSSTSTFDLVVDNVAPTVALALDNTTVNEGSAVTLELSDYVDPGEDTLSQIVVDWGDGQSDTIDIDTGSLPFSDQSLQHVYADGPQNHSIAVTLVDEDGQHLLGKTINVNVLNVRPTITSFDIVASTLGDLPLDLSAAAIDPAVNDDPLTFSWVIAAPDGTQTSLNGDAVSYTPGSDEPGSHVVTLTVTDDEGGVSTQMGTIEVEGPPTANAGGPYEVDEGDVVAIDAAFATDPNQEESTLTFLWDLDADGVFGETDEDALYGDETGISPIFSAPLVDGDAVLDITLRVIDDSGYTSDSQAVVNINNLAPIVEGQTFFIDEGVTNGTFVGQVVARDFVDDVLSFAITGGTGLSAFNIDEDTGEISVADTTQLIHSTTPSFTLDLEVTDDDGSSATATMTVLVEDVESLEVQQFLIDDGAPQQSNFDIISIRFNEATNINGLIQSGSIYDAIQLVDPGGNSVNLDDGQDRFSYDDSTHTLSIDLTTEGVGIGGTTILSADGEYELQLDTDMIQEDDGSHQLLDTDGNEDGVLRFSFERVLGDFNGDGNVNIADRFLFLRHYNTATGDADYNADFDLDGDGDIDRIDYAILRSRLPRR